MSNLIITTPEELRAIVGEAIAQHLPKQTAKESLPDTITLTTALELLAENGYPTSRAKIYKLTSAGTMPHRKYGNNLVFSRAELLKWAEGQSIRIGDHSEAIQTIARSARRKR